MKFFIKICQYPTYRSGNLLAHVKKIKVEDGHRYVEDSDTDVFDKIGKQMYMIGIILKYVSCHCSFLQVTFSIIGMYTYTGLRPILIMHPVLDKSCTV